MRSARLNAIADAAEAFARLARAEAEEDASPQVDEVVPFTRAALTNLELDYAPALVAAQKGELRTVWQGRRRLTTTKWITEYVSSLPPAVAVDVSDDLMLAARARARRVA